VTYWTTAEVAARLRCSTRTIRELTRNDRIPFRIAPYTRPCLFDPLELEAWEQGDFEELQVRHLPGNGRVVSLVRNGRRAA
jgi:hypothetical protein